MQNIDFIGRHFISVKRNTFAFKKFTFFFDKLAVAVACETAEASVGGDDTMARHFRRKRVTFIISFTVLKRKCKNT